MPSALVRITFEDFEKWKAVFDEAASPASPKAPRESAFSVAWISLMKS
jgi:hypothetical protein